LARDPDLFRGGSEDSAATLAHPLERFPIETLSASRAQPAPAPETNRRPREQKLPDPPRQPASPVTFRAVFPEELSAKLVVMEETEQVAVEQYRKLAATLNQLQLQRPSKVVLITSAMSGEGKTLTAMNLALTLSESFHDRVLLVDADLRRPQLHERFQVSSVTGLNESLKSGLDRPLSVVQISPHLLLLPAGGPDSDPMRVLSSERMRHVISEASKQFDWVILDSPAVANLPDAHLLTGLADVAVVVAAAGRTPYAAIARTVDVIGRERVAGIVLNEVEDSALDTSRALAYSNVTDGPTDEDDE
jgi:capsular exopolysaccharide synthesis family protein